MTKWELTLRADKDYRVHVDEAKTMGKMITVSTEIRAPLWDVWTAYTEASHIVQWNAASEDWHTTEAHTDLREGGRFSYRMEARDGSEGFDFEGVFTTILEGQLLEYEFGGRVARVTFSDVEDTSRVVVEFDPESTNSADLQKAGWQAILDNFKKYLETSA